MFLNYVLVWGVGMVAVGSQIGWNCTENGVTQYLLVPGIGIALVTQRGIYSDPPGTGIC